MADVHQLPTLRSVEQEASEWIARLEAEDVTPEDRVRFAAWLRANPQNSRDFEDVSATWCRFVKAGPLADMKTGAGARTTADSDAGADVNAGVSASTGSDGRAEVGVAGGAQTAVVLQHRKRNWGLAIAAAMVVATLLTSVYLQKAPH